MQGIMRSLVVSIWFMFLTFPLVAIRVNTIDNTVIWRWKNVLFIGIGSFVLSFLWRYMMARKELGAGATPFLPAGIRNAFSGMNQKYNESKSTRVSVLALIALGFCALPMLVSSYQTNIMISALLYIMLGLGLNIVVGLAGQLVLGYIAFYAVGAYAYALLSADFGLGFWTVLPIGGACAAVFGILVGFPVLRLKGDYLAIVTLGFGEITRLVLENWGDVTRGPSGISNIPRPSFFGMHMDINASTTYIYYLVFACVIITIIAVARLKDSRIGRAWQALREDEIACEAMGIDLAKTKLSAFALGACWAGFAGVIFAAKTTFINPASFTFLESAMVLAMVVLGGMGSTLGVVLGALILILLPEYLRAFSEYRMLIFGAAMVLMMVFRPQGIIAPKSKEYEVKGAELDNGGKA
ncbi:MAG: branched-chain amino acid ABC transporter permease [Pseudomonadota bacterium]